MASPLNVARIGAAIVGASVALLASTIPATAEVHVKPDSRGDKVGLQVNLEGHDEPFDTRLIGLKVDDAETRVQSYCVELPTELKKDRGLREVPWDQYPNEASPFRKNSAKINWILHHSYPAVPVSQLQEGLSEEEAIAATQAAIWHFSDNAELNVKDPLKSVDEESEKDVVKLYQYLTGSENKGINEQPAPTLKLDPKEKSGKSGELIGPFTVTTTDDQVDVKAKLPKGVLLTDAKGNPLPEPKDDEFSASAEGDKIVDIYVKVPEGVEAGEAKLSVKVEATLEKGRLFIRSDKDKKTQSLIVAAPAKVALEAGAIARWVLAPVVTPPSSTAPPSSSPAPTTTTTTTTTSQTPAAGGSANNDNLASTGASIFWPLGIGVVLVGAGAGVLLFLRRRKSA